MDSPLKFRLKDIVFVKNMDDTIWPAKIVKVIPQYKIFQVSFFNNPSFGFFQECNLLPFSPHFAKKQKRAILANMREHKMLQRTRANIIKGIELALQEQGRAQHEESHQMEAMPQQQMVQYNFMDKSRQLTLESCFQSVKKRKNAVAICPIEKKLSKKQKLEYEIEQVCVSVNEQKVEMIQQQTSRNSGRQRMHSSGYVAQALWLVQAEFTSKKEQGILNHSQIQNNIQPLRQISLYQPFHQDKQQCDPPQQPPSITAETSEDNPAITIKQVENMDNNNTNNDAMPIVALVQYNHQGSELQMQDQQNKPESIEGECIGQKVREQMDANQYASIRVVPEMPEIPKQQQYLDKIFVKEHDILVDNHAQTVENRQIPIQAIQNYVQEHDSVIPSQKNQIQQYQQELNLNQQQENSVLQIKNQFNDNQNQSKVAQQPILKVSPNNCLEINDIISKLVFNEDGRVIMTNAGNNQFNLIQSPFGNEEDANCLMPIPPNPISINLTEENSLTIDLKQEFMVQKYGPYVLGEQQRQDVIVISDGEAQMELSLQTPKASPKKSVISGQIINNDINQVQMVQMFIPFAQLHEDAENQQADTIISLQQLMSRNQRENILKQYQKSDQQIDGDHVQNNQPVNQAPRPNQIMQQLYNAKQKAISANIIAESDINTTFKYQNIRLHQQRHQSFIVPILEQPEEEDQEGDGEDQDGEDEDEEGDYHEDEGDKEGGDQEDAQSMEIEIVQAFRKEDQMEIEDAVEEVSIGKLSKLSVDFKVSLQDERSEGDSDGISNPVFEVLQKKVNLQTELSNIEQLYKRQFVAPHNYPTLISTLPALQKKMKDVPEALLAEVIKQYLSRIIAYLSANTQDPAMLLSFVQKQIFLASITSESLRAETVCSEGILEELERVVYVYEQGAILKGWMSNYLAEYLMVKAKLDYFSYLCRPVAMGEQEVKMCANLAYT